MDTLLGCCCVLWVAFGIFLAKFETDGRTFSYVQMFAEKLPTLLAQRYWEWLRLFARSFSLNRREKNSVVLGEGGGGGEEGGGGNEKAFFSFRY